MFSNDRKLNDHIDFFSLLFDSLTTNFVHYWGESLTNLMLMPAYCQCSSELHREPLNEIGSLTPAEYLVGFEPGTFQFDHNTLTH